MHLSWDAHGVANRFRIWAQWRAPEGEVVHTHEVVVDKSEVQLPPSPARWRPLKLSIELQTLCEGGATSTIVPLRQLQFDAAAQAACLPVDGISFDRQLQRLVWNGQARERFALSFHGVSDGQTQAQLEVIGTSAAWPALVTRPVVIQLVRACGAAQRSQATFQLVR